jgi:hypothetical protein
LKLQADKVAAGLPAKLRDIRARAMWPSPNVTSLQNLLRGSRAGNIFWRRRPGRHSLSWRRS